MTQHNTRRIVAVEDGIVEGTLQRLNLAGIEVVAHVVSETPDNGYVRVGVFQPKEIVTANPAPLVTVLASQRIFKQRDGPPVYIVDVDMPILTAQQRIVGNGTAATEQVYQMTALR